MSSCGGGGGGGSGGGGGGGVAGGGETFELEKKCGANNTGEEPSSSFIS